MSGSHQSQSLSATIITLNEAHNIERCIRSLSFCDEIILVDSHSTDGTAEIAKALGAKVFQKEFQGYGQQKNHAHSLAQNAWVLNIDADEEITPDLEREILSEIQRGQNAGFFIARRTFFGGRWIRYGGWYPNYVARLCRREQGQWSTPGVHEQLMIQGPVGYLKNPLHHYSFRDIAHQVSTNIKYAKRAAKQQFDTKKKFSYFKLLLKPCWKFIHSYFIQRGFLDGFQGFVISVNAAHSMFMRNAFLKEYECSEDGLKESERRDHESTRR